MHPRFLSDMLTGSNEQNSKKKLRKRLRISDN